MRKYILSKTSEYDINKIYEDGVYRFGKTQAIKYLEEINEVLIFLSKNPEARKNRDEIKKKLVSFPYGSHVVFYCIFKKHIRIVRILYGGRDLINFLK